jgi:hypothetical protein
MTFLYTSQSLILASVGYSVGAKLGTWPGHHATIFTHAYATRFPANDPRANHRVPAIKDGEWAISLIDLFLVAIAAVYKAWRTKNLGETNIRTFAAKHGLRNPRSLIVSLTKAGRQKVWVIWKKLP